MIWDIKKYALHDGPGIRSTVFFKGCPLRCAWCCNPESQSFDAELVWQQEDCIGCSTCVSVCSAGAVSRSSQGIVVDLEACSLCSECCEHCPTGAMDLVGRIPDAAALLAEIEKDSAFYLRTGGGLTLSGGEPLAQPGLAVALLEGYRGRLHGRHTAVETSACCPPEALARVLPHTDLFLADIKHMDSDVHRELTGAGNERILANLRRIATSPAELVLRFPLVPGCNDSAANLAATAAFAISLAGVKCLDILPYHRLGEAKYGRLGRCYPMAGTMPPSVKEIERVRELFQAAGLSVRVGG